MRGHAVNFLQLQAAYNTLKTVIVMFESSLAAEWTVHVIRVNSSSLGYMDSIFNDGQRLARSRGTDTSRNPRARWFN
jgi:sorbose reductase